VDADAAEDGERLEQHDVGLAEGGALFLEGETRNESR
jgi:hypothetical protein